MTGALDLAFGIPPWIGYIISAAVVIPLVIYGVQLISRFQLITQPFWIILNIPALRFHRFSRLGKVRPLALLRWRGPFEFAGRRRSPFRSRRIRRGLRRYPGADAADRRAGGLPALPAIRRRPEMAAPAGSVSRRSRLGRGRRAETARRLLPCRADARNRNADARSRRPGPHVPRRLWLHDPQRDAGAAADGGFRGRLAAEDQCDERLCGLARLVELLLAPHPQPSGARRLACLQRGDRAASDGAWHLSPARSDARHLFDRRHGLALHHFGGSLHQQAAWPVAGRYRVQARPPLRYQPGRPGLDVRFRRHCPRRPFRPVRAVDGFARHLCNADRLPDLAGHRLCYQGQILPRPQTAPELEKPGLDHLLDLRTPVRTRGHGLVPGLCRADLFALLLAGQPLPRHVQTARAAEQADRYSCPHRTAGKHHCPADHEARPLCHDRRPRHIGDRCRVGDDRLSGRACGTRQCGGDLRHDLYRLLRLRHLRRHCLLVLCARP